MTDVYPPSKGIIALRNQDVIVDVGRLAATTYTTPFVSGYVQCPSEEERLNYARGVAIVRGVALAQLSLTATSGGGKVAKETSGSLAKKASNIARGQVSKIVASNQSRIAGAHESYTTVELKALAALLFVGVAHGAHPATRADILRPVVIEVALRISRNSAKQAVNAQPL